MFGRKKKVDLEELLQELAGNDDGNVRSRVRKYDGDDEDYVQQAGVKFKVEFEGVDELIKEMRSLRESINELIELLKEQGSVVTKK
ncbi:hypothetical protein [Vulcanisaeta sp. JCM 14467]|uniref:hypothetical protein n=1 Tax=Vulcanisaeta sp. JCM 14467 TaxID=1295370 RepID=UPI0006D160B3|nr:hypothetical protein [Vulcanisaeta sp. JCM 14467]